MIDDGAAPVEAGGGRQQLLRSLGIRNAMLHDFDFWDRGYGHYSKLLGTFLPRTSARRRGHGQRPLRRVGRALRGHGRQAGPDGRAHHPVCWGSP
jgi:hypothetical protein